MVSETSNMEKVVNLCQRRGILFPTADIYGAFAGFFDWGNVGVELKRNLIATWWKHFVRDRQDIVGMDGSIITNPIVWKASGHADSFNDLLVFCKKCNSRHRADHLVEDALKISTDGMSAEKIDSLINENGLKCPKCKGDFGEVKKFNLMFRTHVGSEESEATIAYLRPETAQLIFADFKAIQGASRKKLPFGIAQVGKAFRNEISPRNFVFRVRELEQMEIEFFIHPKKMQECEIPKELLEKRVKVLTAKEQEIGTRFMVEKCIRQLVEEEIIGTKWHAYWLGECLSFLASLGIPLAKLRLRQHVKTELSHYSSETWDIEFDFDSIGWKELQGIANRSDFDLSQHAKFSGKDLSLLQEESGIGGAGGASGESTESAREKVTPFVIEPSIGVERLSLAVLLSAFGEVEKNGEKTAVLKVLPALSPVTVAVFPLMKKDGLSEKAKEVLAEVSRKFTCDYDEAGSIGKRYARHDEIGTPYCVTIDYDSLQDDSVTLRFRDSGRQERVNKGKLADRIQELLLQGVTS